MHIPFNDSTFKKDVKKIIQNKPLIKSCFELAVKELLKTGSNETIKTKIYFNKKKDSVDNLSIGFYKGKMARMRKLKFSFQNVHYRIIYTIYDCCKLHDLCKYSRDNSLGDNCMGAIYFLRFKTRQDADSIYNNPKQQKNLAKKIKNPPMDIESSEDSESQ